MSAERKLLGNSIAREQFLLNEARIVARMRLEGMTEKEVCAKVKAENLFQYPTERTLQKISRACNKRIDALGSDALVRAIAYGMPDAAAQANLYAMMQLYPLVRHFMVTEIAQKYATLDYVYSAMDMNAYFTRLASEFDNFATASEETVKKLIAMEPENITVHTLALKKGSRFLTEGTQLPSGEAVGEMLDRSERLLRSAGYVPYYLYRQKFMSGSFENVGWTKRGRENLYNICIMEELCGILSVGAGGSTKLVENGSVDRLMAPKYPREYIQRIDSVCADKDGIVRFYERLLSK